MAVATLKQVAETLRIENETLSTFSKEWLRLDDVSKTQIREGIGNGSMTY